MTLIRRNSYFLIKVAVLVVGGAAEARQSHPDRIRLVLKNRKGFVKVALTTGTDIGNEFMFYYF